MKSRNDLSEIQVRYSCQIPVKERVQLKGSGDVFELLWKIWNKDLIAYQEAFVILLLNRANRIIGYRWISYGGISSTVVDVRHIFGVSLKCNACSIILAHNHPSGTVRPSQEDLNITNKIKKAGELLDIKVLDHLIVTPEERYYSFADEGVL